MKNSNFDLLMHRYLTGKVSEQERKKIEAWLKIMKAERDTELKLTDQDQERLFQKITSTVDGVDEVISLYPRQSTLKKYISKPWVRIAASVAIIVVVTFGVWSVIRPDPFGSLASGKEKLILNDGTLVWLDKESSFTYYENDGIRHGELKGQALFEVAKVQNSPFLITCGDIRLTVLGTSFSLKTTAGSVELQVLTGHVHLSSREDTTGINVDPNQRVVYSAKGEAQLDSLGGEEIATIIDDTHYDMRFSNTRMEEVISRIEDKFDVKVAVKNRNMNDCRVTVDLTDNSLDSSLVMITELLDVRYTRDKKQIELSGNGCK